MKKHLGSIEPKTTKQKIIRTSILLIIIAALIIGWRTQIERSWKVERVEINQLMTKSLELKDYPAAITAYKRTNKSKSDKELTALYVKANQLDELSIKKEKEEALRVLLNSIRTSILQVRKNKIAQLAEIDPNNQEFADEIKLVIQEKKEEKVKSYKEANEKRQKELFAGQREKQIKSQFSTVYGSHIELEKIIKKSMNDPSSYSHVETRYGDKGDYIFVVTTFRGTNGFGGIVTNSIQAEFTISGELIRIIK